LSERASWWQGKRGEWYVVIQAGLFLLLIFGPRTLPAVPTWPEHLRPTSYILAALLLLAGGTLAVAGVLALGRNLTPLPLPKRDARLVESGPYRLVRHPIYGGIVLMAYGWSLLAGSWLTLGYATLLFLFFDIKSRREERWLRAKYPGYSEYSNKVRKLIPFIY
jgi:protein-S-isoprenylcysteine O-methyltransferase Ste14